jgi:hypothetical protein
MNAERPHMDNAVQQAAGTAEPRGDVDDAALIAQSLRAAALTAYLAQYETTKSSLADALATLLYDAVPPQVRAAAFRALATFPDARNLGPVKDGQSLLIPFPKTEDPWIKLVVDPATSLMHSYTTIKGTIVINTAAWTNQLPRVIPLPPKTACLPGH